MILSFIFVPSLENEHYNNLISFLNRRAHLEVYQDVRN